MAGGALEQHEYGNGPPEGESEVGHEVGAVDRAMQDGSEQRAGEPEA
jgi:hypothetical protein